MKTDEEIRLEIAGLFFRPGGRPQWEDIAGDAEKMYNWVKRGTSAQSGPADAEKSAPPVPGASGTPGPGGIPGQAAQRNQTSRNNPTGRA